MSSTSLTVMYTRIRLKQLIFFLEAARYGSLIKAAEALNVSQPAVTKTIRELESILEVRLFHRTRGGVSLTPFGETLLTHASAVMAELKAGLSRVEALKKGEEGHLAVGAVAIAGSRLLRTTIARMKRDNPFITFTVVPGTIDQLIAALKVGEIDLVIGRPAEPEIMQGIAREVLFHDRLALVARNAHPLTVIEDLRLSEMIRFPWILPLPNTPTRHRLDSAFRTQGLSTPADVIEGIVSAFTYDYLEQTDSIAALPFSLVAEDIRSGRLTELKVDMNQDLGAIELMRQEKIALTKCGQQFVRELHRQVARMRHIRGNGNTEPHPKSYRKKPNS